MTRADAIDRVRQHLHSGVFLADLGRRVAYQTESQNPDRADALDVVAMRLDGAFDGFDGHQRVELAGLLVGKALGEVVVLEVVGEADAQGCLRPAQAAASRAATTSVWVKPACAAASQ